MKTSKTNAFTLIELLVVISIIAILAGIALPVFGEVQVRGAQTKALSNAKQIGLACKLFASDYNGNFPMYTDITTNPKQNAGSGSTSNAVLQTLMPDYLPDKTIFAIPKSAFCKNAGTGSGSPQTLGSAQNEWAYVLGLSDTSNSRWPLLASGFASGGTKYTEDETAPGGVWKAKKAIVIRADISGTVETLNRTTKTVKRSDDDSGDAFVADPSATPPWLGSSISVLNAVAN